MPVYNHPQFSFPSLRLTAAWAQPLDQRFMAHQVLARKWRPQTFADMAGQQHVLQALGNALDQQRLHHAYLLTGTRGVGKTTIARILARCLNCDKGVSRNPCGECGSCMEIQQGRSIDLIEVDAASKTKVEDTRELLENVQFAPTAARYKVYLIDEVHMLSNSSFNALLKTLEEPPPHVVFVLATTHPQKIPATVLSRCLQFHLKNLAEPTIAKRLGEIANSEGIESDEAALLLLARAAAGSMRDGLTLLEQASAFGNGKVDAEQIGDMLGFVDATLLVSLCDAVISGDAAEVLALLNRYAERATDNNVLLDEMLSLFHRAAVEQAVPGAGVEGQLNADAIGRYAAELGPEELQLYYQILLHGKRDMALAPDPRSGLEMLFMRLLAFQALPAAGTAKQDVSTMAPGERAPPQAAQLKKKPAQLATEGIVSPPAGAEFQDSGAAAAANKPVQAAAARDAAAPVQAPASGNASAAFAPQQLDALRWGEMFSALPLSGMVRAIAENMLPIQKAHQPNKLVFALQNSDALLYKPEHCQRIADALSMFFDCKLEVNVKLVDSLQEAGLQGDEETPALRRARL
ncbi:MAG: DNA polymerase III subunit gamma/tau, partial [Pseudomonadales bacterium]